MTETGKKSQNTQKNAVVAKNLVNNKQAVSININYLLQFIPFLLSNYNKLGI